jgi:Tol biopolymer transport system component
VADQQVDIQVWDFSRGTLTRATLDDRFDGFPAWTTDGHRLIFSSERSGARNLYWSAADGTGGVERLTDSPNVHNASSVTPDRRLLIFTETSTATSDDVMQFELNGTHRVTPLVKTPARESEGVVSPDGRWLAYTGPGASDRPEIYVQPFPDVSGGRWQVSTMGGTRPLWGPDGRELFYTSPAGAIMLVGVERRDSWVATVPVTLIKEGYFTLAGTAGRSYDISSDGQRFLMIKNAGTGDPANAPKVMVVQHWTEELKWLVPTR